MALKYAGDVSLPPELAQYVDADREDFEWWAKNYQALWQKHRGQYIAICDRRVIAAGPDAAEVSRQADAQFPDRGVPVVYMPREIRRRIL